MSLLASAVVFSSCRGGDDDDNGPGTTTTTGSSYDVTAHQVKGGANDSLFVLGSNLNGITSITFSNGGSGVAVAVDFDESTGNTYLDPANDLIKLEIPGTAVSGPVTISNGTDEVEFFAYINEDVLLVSDFDLGGVRATDGEAASAGATNSVGTWWGTGFDNSLSRNQHGIVSSYTSGGASIPASPAGGNFIVYNVQRGTGTTNFSSFIFHDTKKTNDGPLTNNWVPFDELTVGALHGKDIDLDNPLSWTASTDPGTVYLNFYVYRPTTGTASNYDFAPAVGPIDGTYEPDNTAVNGGYRKAFQSTGTPIAGDAWTWVSIPFDEMLDGFGFGSAMPMAAVEDNAYIRFNVNINTTSSNFIFAIDHVVISQGGAATEPTLD